MQYIHNQGITLKPNNINNIYLIRELIFQPQMFPENLGDYLGWAARKKLIL